MKKQLLVLVTLFFHAFGYSQNMTSEEAKALKQKTLLVTIDDITPDEIARMQKRGDDIERWKKLINGNNQKLRTAIEKYWKFSEHYEFVSVVTAMEKLDKNPEQYAVISLQSRFIEKPVLQTRFYIPKSKKMEPFTPDPFFLYLWSPDLKQKIDLHSEGLFHKGKLNEISLTLGLRELQYYLNKLSEEQNMDMTKVKALCHGLGLTKTKLLIDQEWVDPKLTEEEIKIYYPYDFKLCPKSEIDQAIQEGTDVAITRFFVGTRTIQFHLNDPSMSKDYLAAYFFNASTGEPYGMVVPSVITDFSKLEFNKAEVKKLKELTDCK